MVVELYVNITIVNEWSKEVCAGFLHQYVHAQVCSLMLKGMWQYIRAKFRNVTKNGS